jgi:hypothetical protein
LHALLGWTLNERIKLLLPNYLINLKTAGIAYIDCHLDLWLYVACANNNSSYRNKRTDLLAFYLPHFTNTFLAKLAKNNNYLVCAFELLRNHSFGGLVSRARSHKSLAHRYLVILLDVVPPLVHYDLKGSEFGLREVD